MSVRYLGTGVCVLAVVAGAFAQTGPEGPGSNVFGLTKVHPFHLTILAKDYAAMDPPARPAPKAPGGPGRALPGPGDFGAGNFGFDFPYVHADFHTEHQSIEGVGIRYKGSGTYLVSMRSAKRSFKIDFDRYDEKLAFAGNKKLNLNSGVLDPSKAREALAYEVFRTAGVPAPRTAFAEVTLTVPGKYEKEYLGLYTVVEQVDKSFLKAHFQNSKGMLLKPEGIRGLPYLGDNPTAYKQPYNPRSEPDPGDWKRLIAFTRLVNRSNEAEFQNEIRSYLDLESFIRFLAVNTLLASLDGFLGLGHNYYLYLSPETNRFTFIPWDLDLAFGAFAIYGTSEQLTELSLDHPHLGENKLIDRLLAMPEVKAAYREQVRRLMAEVFNPEKLGKKFAAIEAATKESLARERKAGQARPEGGGFGPPAMGPLFGGLPVPRFLERRTASVTAQLSGTSKGYVPAMMAFGQPPGPGANPFPGVGIPLARPLRDALDTNRDGVVSEAEFSAGMKQLFHEWDRDRNGSLDQREINEGLQRLAQPRK